MGISVKEGANGGGIGNVTGPSSSTDNAISRFDGATGRLIQDSNVTIDDNGTINIPAGETYQINSNDVVDQDVTSGSSPTFSGANITTELSNDISPVLGGDLDLAERSIIIDKPDANGEYSALEKVSETVDTNGVGVFAVLEMAVDGHFDEADADAEATCDGPLALALETGTGTKLVMYKGWALSTGWTWTVGQPLYVSTTQGTMTQTAPSGSGDIVRKVGIAHSANLIRFDPSPDYIEIP